MSKELASIRKDAEWVKVQNGDRPYMQMLGELIERLAAEVQRIKKRPRKKKARTR